MSNAHTELLRLNVCILAVLGFIVGIFVAGVTAPVPFSFFVAIVVVFLICGGGNAINDYYDYETDKLSKSHRPLPSGRISMENTKRYAIILLFVGVLLAVVFFSQIAIIYTIFNAGLVWVYSWKLKKTPIGHFVDSWLAVSPFILGGLLISNISGPLLILSSMAFLGNLGREIVKGMEDMGSDKLAGMKTLEIVLGKKISKIISGVLIIFAIILSFVPYLLGDMGIGYLFFILIGDCIFGYSLTKLSSPKQSQKIMKVGMFMVMLAFLIGILF
jgi:geranylgeranylglycerol-phosphate geranylgeranyltransferase